MTHDWSLDGIVWQTPYSDRHRAIWRCLRCGAVCGQYMPKSVGLHGADAYKPLRGYLLAGVMEDCDDEAVRLIIES